MAELTQFFRSAFPSVDPVVVDAVCGRLGDPSAIGEALSAMAEPNGRDDAKRARHAKPAPAAATRSKHATAASYEPTPLAQILLRNIELRVGESPRRDAPSGATAAAAAAAAAAATDEGHQRAASASGADGGITDVLAQATGAAGTPPSPLDSAADCVVCLEISRQVVLLPCRHLCLCEGCSQNVHVCPVCRAHVTDKMSVFMS